MKDTLIKIFRDFSAILAGFKLAIIVISYFGFGSLAKWVLEQWYPFTRWMWDNVFAYLNLPEITDIEKDALTAIFFFLPLGATAIIAPSNRIRDLDSPRIQLISAPLGLLFIYAICGNLITFVLSTVNVKDQLLSFAVDVFSNNYAFVLSVLAGYAISSIVLPIGNRIIQREFLRRKVLRRWLQNLSRFDLKAVSFLEHFTERILKLLQQIVPKAVQRIVFKPAERAAPWPVQRIVPKLDERIASKPVQRIIPKLGRGIAIANRVLLILLVVVQITVALHITTDTDSYLPLFAIGLVIVSVILSIFRTPRKLMMAAGASLAFISTAYAYEILILTKGFIEDAVP